MNNRKPFSLKWVPGFYKTITNRLKMQKVLLRVRIRNITDGLTMPEITNVPIGSGKRMEAAILFFDLKDFTSITSKLKNEQVLYMLNTIIPQMMHVVKRWRGEIEKNTGDGIMAIIGTETRDSFLIARDAIETAMAMRYIMLNAIQANFIEKGIPFLNFRIGIDMGEVLISRIGIDGTNHLVVIGDAANRASKLQGFASSNGIVLGENMYSNLHSLLQGYCNEEKHEDWKWSYTQPEKPYRFFSFNLDFAEPSEWVKIIARLKYL
ncbi:MAG: adenylate/guanylate cyclase domain-containing protein [Nitrospirae bacterium]|nr:adenylate/guanylate cyclase domain-containing protein [Nitrospirota bacterium]